MRGLKFFETLVITFQKQIADELEFKTAYFNSQAQTIINHTEIAEALESSKQHILNKVVQRVSEGSGWIITSVDYHYLNLVKYIPMKGSTHIQLPKELQNGAKGLINMKNEDNQCFRWCHIRHLNPQDTNTQRIKKSDKVVIKNLDYTGIEFPVTIKQVNKIEKQNNISINIFGMKTNNHILSMYQKKGMKIIWIYY